MILYSCTSKNLSNRTFSLFKIKYISKDNDLFQVKFQFLTQHGIKISCHLYNMLLSYA